MIKRLLVLNPYLIQMNVAKVMFFVLCMCLFLSEGVFAAKKQSFNPATPIADSLKTNAHSVLRYENELFVMHNESSGTYKVQKLITVLNDKGRTHGDCYISASKYRKLKSFSAILYDGAGKQLKKFKMSDLSSSEMTDAVTLADDVKHYFMKCVSPVMPYSVMYEYEMDYSRGFLSFPMFVPLGMSNQSVESASYDLQTPIDAVVLLHAVNTNLSPTITETAKQKLYRWEMGALKAIEMEDYMPSTFDIIKRIYMRPANTIYDGENTAIDSWESLGKWVYDISKDRQQLPPEAVSKVKALVADVDTDREKLKVLYDYLGKTTRYVSIQLGIGGFRPMSATEVYKTGFGDCKALSNYMKAMLDVVGIPSVYCVIASDNYQKTVFPNYANFNQFNHAILQVPLPGDTLWLECTNPKIPFGYVHKGIAGNDVLLITPEGGVMQKTTSYCYTQNIENNHSLVRIAPDGSAVVTSTKFFRNKDYENNMQFTLLKPNEQNDFLRTDIALPQVALSKLSFDEQKNTSPTLQINYEWTTNSYGTRTGTRLFVPLNAFGKQSANMAIKQRVYDIVQYNAYMETDSFEIQIPEGFALENIAASMDLESEFGRFKSEISQQGNVVFVKQSLEVYAGQWPPSKYPDFVTFRNKLNEAYKARMVLSKR